MGFAKIIPLQFRRSIILYTTFSFRQNCPPLFLFKNSEVEFLIILLTQFLFNFKTSFYLTPFITFIPLLLSVFSFSMAKVFSMGFLNQLQQPKKFLLPKFQRRNNTSDVALLDFFVIPLSFSFFLFSPKEGRKRLVPL